MMGDNSWATEPFLGLVPHFHADPVEGGAPIASVDGHWWWDGQAWQPLVANDEQPAPAVAGAG
jgi:hypothetical protein